VGYSTADRLPLQELLGGHTRVRADQSLPGLAKVCEASGHF
jgi:hypothetical protein